MVLQPAKMMCSSFPASMTRRAKAPNEPATCSLNSLNSSKTHQIQPTSGCRMRCCITSRVTPTVKTRPSGRQRRLLRPRPVRHSVSLTSHKPNCPQTNLASSPTTSHQADSGRTTPDGAEGWRQANLRVNMGHRGVPGSSDGHHITTLRLARRPATSSERESLQGAFSTRFTGYRPSGAASHMRAAGQAQAATASSSTPMALERAIPCRSARERTRGSPLPLGLADAALSSLLAEIMDPPDLRDHGSMTMTGL